MRRLLGLLFGVSAVLTTTALPVGAHECTLEAIQRNETFFTIHGTGFEPNETVELSVFFEGSSAIPPFSKEADAEGVFGEGLTFSQSDPPGEYTVTATGESCTAETTISWMPDTATETPEQTHGSLGHLLLVAAAGLIAFVAVLRSTRSGRSRSNPKG